MAEPFSHRLSIEDMGDLDDHESVYDVLRDLLATDRVFYGTVRFLDGQTRNHLVAAHMRNNALLLQILRTMVSRPSPPTSLVMNIDMSGNVLRNFMDPVPVVATVAQITAATEPGVETNGETCSICRDGIGIGTRLRFCGHCFHSECIGQWLGMNTRCPVCRHDIRIQAAYAPQANPTE